MVPGPTSPPALHEAKRGFRSQWLPSGAPREERLSSMIHTFKKRRLSHQEANKVQEIVK